MDAPLRQRLIGAAVIIAIAVIFLPMLLEGPGPSGPTEVALEIPPPGSGRDLETRLLPVHPPAQAPAAEPVAAPTIEAPTTVSTPPASIDAAAPEPTAAPVSEAPVPDPATPAPAQPTASIGPPPSTTPTPSPLPSAPSRPESGRFVVQLGSYGSERNAQELVRQLAPHGIRAEIAPLDSGGRTLYRVRSQAFERREDAEAARVRATAAVANLATSISELSLPTPTASTAPAATGTGMAFAVQLGVFANPQSAASLVDRARAAGFPAYTESVPIGGATQYRVRVGPELKRENAERTKAALKARLALDGIIVSHP